MCKTRSCARNNGNRFGKLAKTQETPMSYMELPLKGSYRMESNIKKEDLRWNSEQLKQYYF